MSNRQRYSHLDALENQSVYLIREAYQKFGNLGLLWSIGKDSSVLLWLLRKAFFGHIPIPCIHVDTGYKLREMIEFRDRLAAEWGLNLVIGQNRPVLAEGRTFPNGRVTRVECCGALKKDALQAIIEEKGYDAVIVGIRRDEEGTRAKERYFSPRNRNFEWDFKEQPPELWDQFKTDYDPGTHIRVHPLLHWTELNVWEYIDREGIPIVDLYLAREGMRYRSLGCAPCTRPVPSTARSVREIIAELQTTKTSERSTRAQDQESEDAFERLRASGYM